MMSVDEKLQNKQYDELWQEYCGFIDLSLPQFMDIQKRLLHEQMELYSKCELGKRIMRGKKPTSIEEFRKVVPLTTYEDYADLLLAKVESALPAKPLLWLQTTWEGARNPIKVAPYTEQMVESFKSSIFSIIIFATSHQRGQFDLRGGENFLYGMAPMPYLSGLIPHLVSSEMSVNFMPSIQEAEAAGFRERSKIGFKMGMRNGVDLFFGMSSVIARMGDTFAAESSKGTSLNILKNSAQMNARLFKAWMNSRHEKTPIKPKDIWKLKGLACTGTDTAILKKKIEQDWGVKPLEIFAGTESNCIATETWGKNGLVFFPDVDFYEFIPQFELDKTMVDPSYIPSTYLLDELVAGNKYELVITSLKGGAFARYRTNDMFKCISLRNEEDNIDFPQFEYIDRSPAIIDIAGFTRITEATISEALRISKLDIDDWFAIKETDNKNRAYLHLYVEVGMDGMRVGLNQEIINEHLGIYFRHIDSDFKDLKNLLGIEPLKVSILPRGTLNQFVDCFGRDIRRINPSHYDVIEVLKLAGGGSRKEVS